MIPSSSILAILFIYASILSIILTLFFKVSKLGLMWNKHSICSPSCQELLTGPLWVWFLNYLTVPSSTGLTDEFLKPGSHQVKSWLSILCPHIGTRLCLCFGTMEDQSARKCGEKEVPCLFGSDEWTKYWNLNWY